VIITNLVVYYYHY